MQRYSDDVTEALPRCYKTVKKAISAQQHAKHETKVSNNETNKRFEEILRDTTEEAYNRLLLCAVLGEQPKAEATVFESVELFDGDQFILLLRFLGRFFGR